MFRRSNKGELFFSEEKQILIRMILFLFFMNMEIIIIFEMIKLG